MQNLEESILFRAHPHPIILIRLLVVAVVLALTPLATFGLWKGLGVLWIPLIIWLLVLISYAYYCVQKWVSNVVIVTNSHVVVRLGSLRNQSTWSLPIDKIERAGITYSSRFNRLLALGTVELMAGDQTMILRQLNHPEVVLNVITKVTEYLSNISIQNEDTVLNQGNTYENNNVNLRPATLISDEDLEKPLPAQSAQSSLAPVEGQQIDQLVFAPADIDINELTEGEAVYF